MPGRALLVVVAAAFFAAVPASADESVQFTLGRVVHTTPDARGRIGIRSTCSDQSGCKVSYTIKHGTQMLGGTQALLLASTVQTDYVTLSKRTAATLRKRRMQVTISADASNTAGARSTQKKTVVLGPKKRR